jgi:hypothetical protein
MSGGTTRLRPPTRLRPRPVLRPPTRPPRGNRCRAGELEAMAHTGGGLVPREQGTGTHCLTTVTARHDGEAGLTTVTTVGAGP